ncbi:uncharacterized protein [Venturia canescens]|uniref:uncharacterized protein n=1 Tax=Venturia canescens TaxID=32260 RepID=UPI001C9CB38C|nr:uncharacterized protein LOC122414778 [Venturia canescens]
MNERIFLLVALALPVVTIVFVDGKLMPVQQKSSDLGSITAKVLKSCYEERLNVIGLAGQISDSFISSISSGDPLSIVLLNSEKESVESEKVSRWSRHKLQVFAVMVPSSLELERALVHIKQSRWWNHMAQFYIIDSTDGEIGCSGAFEFLWRAWTTNILGAKFVCNDGVKGPFIYAFNPYTKSAPSPWRFTKSYKGVNDHPWALFKRKFNNNENICKNIDFDQTRNAGGYEVRYAMSQHEMPPKGSKATTFVRFAAIDKYLHMMSHYMNISLKTLLYSRGESLGFLDNEGKGHGMLSDLTNGRADLISRYIAQQSIPELPATYPIVYGKYFAVTQNTAYISQWHKIVSILDVYSRIGLLVVCILTVMFLRYALGQSFMIAILNIWRLICNSCLTKLPNNLGPRIYLACLLIFVVVLQGVYQGKWAALMTRQIRYPNINNKRDLIDSDYVIYGRINDSLVFSNPAFNNRYVGINYDNESCIDYLLQNSSIACVSGRSYLLKSVIKLKLHMSHNQYPVHEFALSQPVRPDWPMQEKLNWLNLRYVESGIFDHVYETTYGEDERILDFRRYEENDDSPKVIFLKDLDFAFVIFAIGMGSALVSFVVELYVGRGRSSRAKDRRRSRILPMTFSKTRGLVTKRQHTSRLNHLRCLQDPSLRFDSRQ